MSIVCAGPMKWVQLDMVLTQDTQRGGGWCDAVIVAMTTCPVEHVNTMWMLSAQCGPRGQPKECTTSEEVYLCLLPPGWR